MIESVYISHSSKCAGWDIDEIIKGTVFKKGCRTMRFPGDNSKEGPETIKMLDWDFIQAQKDFGKVWNRHLEIAQTYDFEIIFAPDSFVESDPLEIMNKADKLLDCCNRVVIPLSGFFEDYIGYELALPIAGGFQKAPKNYWLWDVRSYITHILGGSPHSHIDYMGYCPNVRSCDGNQLFTLAIKAGKYWKSGKWLKPEYDMSNEDIFKLSIDNVDRSLRERVVPVSRRI